MFDKIVDFFPPKGCTDTFNQLLCVEFEVTFNVDVDCRVVDVQCIGEPNGPSTPCVFVVTHPVTGSTATYYITFEGVTPVGNNSRWCYSVRVEGDPALSHWILELCCDPFPTIVPGSVTRNGLPADYEIVEPGHELGPNKCGIKFEDEVDESDGTVQYCFELEGQFATVLRDAAAKGGPAPDVIHENCLPGPDCP